jgi:hypothetical protein
MTDEIIFSVKRKGPTFVIMIGARNKSEMLLLRTSLQSALENIDEIIKADKSCVDNCETCLEKSVCEIKEVEKGFKDLDNTMSKMTLGDKVQLAKDLMGVMQEFDQIDQKDETAMRAHVEKLKNILKGR